MGPPCERPPQANGESYSPAQRLTDMALTPYSRAVARRLLPPRYAITAPALSPAGTRGLPQRERKRGSSRTQTASVFVTGQPPNRSTAALRPTPHSKYASTARRRSQSLYKTRLLTIPVSNIPSAPPKGVDVEFVGNPELNTGAPQAGLTLRVLAAVAQMEHAMIRERQAQGIAIAKRKGVYERGTKLTAEQIALARRKVADGVAKARVARDLGVSRQTLYAALQGAGRYAEVSS
ncbi:MAG: recombinase family protein [Bifidobacterium sp.]|uniref:recombinase family protein n=1 Tax=Bifidobacterium sp. TaxID=41200 RepID=UPI0039E97F8C